MTLIGNGVVLGTGRGRGFGLRLEGERIAEVFFTPVRSKPDIDLDGAYVLPGLVDTHLHVRALGRSERAAAAKTINTLGELGAALRETTPASTGIRYAIGWCSSSPRPSLAWFDKEFPGEAVVVLCQDLHSGFASRTALARFGTPLATALAGTTDEHGFGRDGSGELTGYVRDRALELLTGGFVTGDDDGLTDDLLLGLEKCAAAGLTEVHEMATSPAMWRAFRELDERGRLPVRVCCYGFGAPEHWMSEMIDEPSNRLRFCGFKVFLDGALGSHGAWLSEPYSDLSGDSSAPCGFERCGYEELERWWSLATQQGRQLALHAIGDAAVARALSLPQRGDGTLRVEHAQVVRPIDVPRFDGVIAAMQPHHRRDDDAILTSRLGARASWAFPFVELERAGALVCFGSDAPVSTLSPLEGMRAAREFGVWDPLPGYTTAAKRASRSPDTGRLEAGARADFVVLDFAPADPRARIRERWLDGECLRL
ncbi:MAG: amidohydrolase family protein [Myxococcota bacterium]